MKSVQSVLVRLSFRSAVDQGLEKNWFVSWLHRMRQGKCIMDNLLGEEGQCCHAIVKWLRWHLVCPRVTVLRRLDLVRVVVLLHPVLRRREGMGRMLAHAGWGRVVVRGIGSI